MIDKYLLKTYYFTSLSEYDTLTMKKIIDFGNLFVKGDRKVLLIVLPRTISIIVMR